VGRWLAPVNGEVRGRHWPRSNVHHRIETIRNMKAPAWQLGMLRVGSNTLILRQMTAPDDTRVAALQSLQS
jgi:hypothetical protein